MTRKGKIARLPHPVREQINFRLQNGEEGKQIAAWLNTLPEVTALLAGEFDGQPVNETNLSNWKLGGYRDWEAQQEALAAVRRFGADAAEFSQATAGPLADHLALCLTARLAVALQRPPDNGDDPSAQMQHLRPLCADLAALRKGDHDAEWLRIERARLDLYRKKHDDEIAARQRAAEDALKAENQRSFLREILTCRSK
jgi:hypothetical protein